MPKTRMSIRLTARSQARAHRCGSLEWPCLDSVDSLCMNRRAMSKVRKSGFCLALFCVCAVQAQLAVSIAPPKVSGQKAVVTLAMKNNFAEKVESARAVVFLFDEQGKMVGQ